MQVSSGPSENRSSRRQRARSAGAAGGIGGPGQRSSIVVQHDREIVDQVLAVAQSRHLASGIHCEELRLLVVAGQLVAVEPRAMLEISDRDRPMPSLDLLPDEIRTCVLEAPLSAKIVDVSSGPLLEGLGDWRYREVTARIDRGTADGVFDGTMLYLRGALESGTVRSVTQDSAIVRLLVDEERPLLPLGGMLATRPRASSSEASQPSLEATLANLHVLSAPTLPCVFLQRYHCL